MSFGFIVASDWIEELSKSGQCTLVRLATNQTCGAIERHANRRQGFEIVEKLWLVALFIFAHGSRTRMRFSLHRFVDMSTGFGWCGSLFSSFS